SSPRAPGVSPHRWFGAREGRLWRRYCDVGTSSRCPESRMNQGGATRVVAVVAPITVALAPTGLPSCTDTAQSMSPPQVTLREDLRLDANAEDFSAVTRVSIGPRGQIAIPLYRDLHVRLYDADGRRIATVGRRGSGPGEFGSLTALGWIRDTLWVL